MMAFCEPLKEESTPIYEVIYLHKSYWI